MDLKFEPNVEGKATARIGNLEISISASADNQEYMADIFVYENRIEVPCEYENCPKKIESDNCEFYTGDIENCPYCFKEEQIDSYMSFSERTLFNIKQKISDMLKNNDDGLGHRHDWPQQAASEFLHRNWFLNIS